MKTFFGAAGCRGARRPAMRQLSAISFKSMRRLLALSATKNRRFRRSASGALARIAQRRRTIMARTCCLDLPRRPPCGRSPAANSIGSPNCTSTSIAPSRSSAEQMRHEIGCRRSRRPATRAAAHRHAVQARVGDRHRLDVDAFGIAAAKRHVGGAEQRALERQQMIAVAGAAFGEQHHRIAAGQARRDLAGLLAGLALALALDEDGALQPRQRAEDRPAGDLRLGDEGRRRRASR